MVRGAVRVVEPHGRRVSRRCSAAASRRPAWCRSCNRTGWVVPAVMVSSRSVVPGVWVAIMKIVERPSWVRVKRRWVWRLRRALDRDIDTPQNLTRSKDILVVPGDEIGRIDGARRPVGRPQRVGRLQRDRHGDHRAGGQGHADVAADRRRVPHLERRQESFAAGASITGPRANRRRGKRVQVANGARRADLEAGLADTRVRPSPAARDRRGGAASGCGSENSHVPPASQASPVAPVCARSVGWSPNDIGDGVEVHGALPRDGSSFQHPTCVNAEFVTLITIRRHWGFRCTDG